MSLGAFVVGIGDWSAVLHACIVGISDIRVDDCFVFVFLSSGSGN